MSSIKLSFDIRRDEDNLKTLDIVEHDDYGTRVITSITADDIRWLLGMKESWEDEK